MLGLAGRSAQIMQQRIAALTVSALLLVAALLASPAAAQSFPELTGRVVDAANIIPADEKVRLEQKLQALETQSGRQLVVATIPDLQGYDIADYGYQLGRKWAIGAKDKNDGAILLVAPKERKVRIEVGYGLEGFLTDGLSSIIIQQQIVPRFKAGDMPGGIEAGTDALIRQLALPPDQARQVAAAAQPKAARDGGIPLSTFAWLAFFLLFFILPMLRRSRRGSAYGGGLGPIILWSVLDGMSRGGGGGGSGGGGSDWGGGGGFSGGGGSFGGGGSSGSW